MRWEIRPIHPTLRIENGSLDVLELYRDGSWITRLAPGAAYILSGQRGKNLDISAFSLDGLVRYHYDFQPQKGHSPNWRIEGRFASVHIQNQRGESVSIFVNGSRLGEIAPEDGLTFTGIPQGRRFFEALGTRTGSVQRREWLIQESQEGRTPTWTLEQPEGVVVLANHTQEPLIALTGNTNEVH